MASILSSPVPVFIPVLIAVFIEALLPAALSYLPLRRSSPLLLLSPRRLIPLTDLKPGSGSSFPRNCLRHLRACQFFKKDDPDVILFYIINDFRHPCRIRFRIRGQSLDAHLGQPISVAEITKGLMGHHNALIGQGRQRILIFPVQLIKRLKIGLIIFFIVILVVRICFDISIFYVFHFFLRVLRTEPYMGIELTVAFPECKSAGGFRHDQVPGFQAGQHIIGPMLQPRPL